MMCTEASVRLGPRLATMGPWPPSRWSGSRSSSCWALTLAHLNVAEASGELSPRAPLLMGIRDKLADALREDP